MTKATPIIRSILLVGIACSIGCERFERSTGIGSDLINDLDPGIGDASAIIRKTTCSLPVLESFSRRDTVNFHTPGLHKHIDTTMTVGRLRKELSLGYFEFDSTYRFDGIDSVINLTLVIAASRHNNSNNGYPVIIHLEACNKKIPSVLQQPPDGLNRLTTFELNPSTDSTFDTARFELDKSKSLFSERIVVIPKTIARYDTIETATVCETPESDTTTVDTAFSDIIDMLIPFPLGWSDFVSTITLTYTDAADDTADTVLSLPPGTIYRDLSQFELPAEWTVLKNVAGTFCFDTLAGDTLANVFESAGNRIVCDTILPAKTWRSHNNDNSYFDLTATDTVLISQIIHYDSTIVESTFSNLSFIKYTVTVYDTIPDEPPVGDTTFSDTLSGRHFTMRDLTIMTSTVADTLLLRSDQTDPSKGCYTLLHIVPRDSVIADTSDVRTEITLSQRHFCLAPDNTAENLLTIKAPYISIIHVTSDTLFDTIMVPCKYADYSVHEEESGRDTIPISSWASARYTIAKLDLSPLWESMNDTVNDREFNEILTATTELSILPDGFRSENDTLAIYYGIKERYDSIAVATLNYMNFPNHKQSGTTSSLSVPMHKSLKTLVRKGKPSTAYLMILIFSEKGKWKTVQWDLNQNSAVNISEAVFTDPR